MPTPISTLPLALQRRQPLALAALALCCSALTASAWSQTVPDAGRLLEEARPPLRPPLPSATPPRVVDAPVRPTVTMPDGVTVTVTGFRISGAVSFPADDLAALVQPWVGRKLDLAGLNEAAGAITRRYQSAGHLLTYAYLPAQRVADGVIEIAVLEGRLEGVQIVTAQDVRLRDEVIQAHTDPLSTDAANPRPVLQADVERQMLLLNDVPGVTARAAFTPGATTGAAELVVSVAEDAPLVISATLDNHGSRSTGEYRAGLNLQLRDVFGWGDSTTGRALVSNRGGLVSGSLGSSVPIGGNGYRMGATLSRLTYHLGGNFANVGATGTADAASLDASYPMLRSADTNVSLKGSLEGKRLRDDINFASGFNVHKNSKALDVGLVFDNRDSWGGLTAGSLTATQGNLRFDNDEGRANDASTLQTAGTYRKLLGQFIRQQAIAGPWSVSVRLAGQASGRNLDSSEKLALAGPGGVRAYAPGEVSVDQGGLTSLELRYGMDYLGGNIVWALFHDRAEGRINRRATLAALAPAAPTATTTANDQRISGSGLAVQWSGGDVGLTASVAWRGSHVPTADGGDAKPRLYFQLVLTP